MQGCLSVGRWRFMFSGSWNCAAALHGPCSSPGKLLGSSSSKRNPSGSFVLPFHCLTWLFECGLSAHYSLAIPRPPLISMSVVSRRNSGNPINSHTTGRRDSRLCSISHPRQAEQSGEPPLRKASSSFFPVEVRHHRKNPIAGCRLGFTLKASVPEPEPAMQR